MTQVFDFKIGDLVYEPYKPMHYGKVIDTKVENKHGINYDYCLVRWKDGTEDWNWNIHLNSLEHLVNSTRKKLGTHEENLEAAKKL